MERKYIKYKKANGVHTRIWKALVVDILISPPSIQPVSLYLSRSSQFQNTQTSFF